MKKIEIWNWVADDVCARGITRFRTYVARIDEIPGELHDFLARTRYCGEYSRAVTHEWKARGCNRFIENL